MSANIEDLTVDPIWRPDEWLRRGKKYPHTDIPPAIQLGQRIALAIPAEYQALFPDPHLSVKEFLGFPLPSVEHGLISSQAPTAFSRKPPASTLTWLMHRPIPPSSLLDSLEQAWGQQWFNGASSFVDPRYKGDDSLPFWVLKWWRQMSSIIGAKGRWVKADAWLAKATHGYSGNEDIPAVAIGKASEILKYLSWNAPVDVLGASTKTLEFSRLISDDWINDDILDMMMNELNLRVQCDPKLAGYIRVESLSFSSVVLRGAARKDFNSKMLMQLVSVVKQSSCRLLLLPYHHNTSHWIAFQINLELWTISYGDSLGTLSTPPSRMVGALQQWILAAFGKKSTVLGNTLVHGIQEDTSSCGIIVANTMAHAIFGDQLWSPRKRKLARIEWFVNIVDHHQNKLRLMAPWQPQGTTSSQDVIMQSDESLTADMIDPPVGPDPGVSVASLGENTSRTDLSEDKTFPESGRPPKRARRESGELPIPDRKRPKNAALLTGIKATPQRTDASESLERSGGTIGVSKSARHDAAANAAVLAGSFKWDEGKLAKWRTNIKEVDQHAEFDESNMHIRHSKCGKKTKIVAPYNITRFRKHVKACVRTPMGGGTPTIMTFFTKASRDGSAGKQAIRPAHPAEDTTRMLCPGITAEREPKVLQYLKRTGAAGGGGEALGSVSLSVYKKEYKDLDKSDQEIVQDVQRWGKTWWNDPTHLRVFAVTCTKHVSVAPGSDGPPICRPCLNVLRDKRFKNAINIRIPSPGKYKYLNKEYQNESLGEKFAMSKGWQSLLSEKDPNKSLPLRFAEQAARGDFAENPVFLGLVEAMVLKNDKARRGVGLQNFKYSPAFDTFAQLTTITSARAYRMFRLHFQARDQRNFQLKAASRPRFPIGITQRTFDIAEEYVRSVQYSGPLALSCDDTKLFAAFRMFYDGTDKQWYLVGGVGDPIKVEDIDELRAIVAAGHIQKATKASPGQQLRLWCLQIPLPKVPPLILAAMPISGDLKSHDLLPILNKIIFGLWERHICVLSYACDGTELERSLQRQVVAAASTGTYFIPTPEGIPDVKIAMPLFDNNPLVIIQDSKHGLKTYRNNLFSGARLLVLGNYLATYGTMHRVAFTKNSPLYHRDVTKLDRQDDRAATRLFSAATMAHLANHHPDEAGQMIYLFVFGELIDAYQNRSMPHLQRIHIALRTRFFMDIWSKFLETAGYPANKYFLSRESQDITRILIEGLILLVVTYCDHVDHTKGPVPLLPWLHSSETCEHTFGECRRIVKDFTYLDFLYMVPKLRILLQTAISAHSADDSRDCAAGYAHTWFDCAGIDLVNLATYPSDEDIATTTQEAYEAAENLFAALDVVPPLFMNKPTPGAMPRLPGIASLLRDDSDTDGSAEEFEPEEEEDEATKLQQIIASEEDILRPNATHMQVQELTFAAVATMVDETMRIHEYPDEDEESKSRDTKAIENALQAAQDINLPSINAPDERKLAWDLGVFNMKHHDFAALVIHRERNQTHQAASGIRCNEIQHPTEEVTTRRQLIRAFEQVLREQQDHAIGSGLERQVRWTQKDGVSHNTAGLPTGNAANAQLAANNHATEAVKRRARIFTGHKVPLVHVLREANISILRPLSPGDYGITWVDGTLMIGRVIWLYSKGGGKYGSHGLISHADNIGQVSYLALQVYENAFRGQFQPIPTATSFLFAVKYVHLPATAFLCRLQEVPQFLQGKNGPMELTDTSLDHFQQLSRARNVIKNAVKSLGSVRQKLNAEHGDDGF